MLLLTVKKKCLYHVLILSGWWVNDCSVLTRRDRMTNQSSPVEKRCLFIHMLYSHTWSSVAKQGCNHRENIVGDQICWRGHNISCHSKLKFSLTHGINYFFFRWLTVCCITLHCSVLAFFPLIFLIL